MKLSRCFELQNRAFSSLGWYTNPHSIDHEPILGPRLALTSWYTRTLSISNESSNENLVTTETLFPSFTSHERSERGGEAHGGEDGGHNPLEEPEHANERRAFPLQQDLWVQLHHSRPALPHDLHLRHRPPHGTRIRRPLPQVALLWPRRSLPRSRS